MRAMYLSLIGFALAITVNCPSGECDGKNCLNANIAGCDACDKANQHCYNFCNQPHTCPIKCKVHCDSR
ncbi:BZ3500_MvSof-1268-A1-R1_Chr11-3g03568 [Microbotryum saponariae]|uniref:BZ3500_MvSof-1268-A1-R1_Chr11-3g03568 protein n=1 Tax=Microbotryum saponariae TaxID=289078 RepID=A0A2X0KMU2_9BASI|nr:BZ3500_MvSof-1268-A1-R1_Chr11-3g03568 [Microbotryum saponariae]SDA03577.1 BZ3501_MvSof-1269-A2-R1_Chr11g03145 [Microbotryum saponariae]